MTSEEIEKYSRQLILSGWSLALQKAIRDTVILVEPGLEFAKTYLEALGVERFITDGDADLFIRHKRTSDSLGPEIVVEQDSVRLYEGGSVRSFSLPVFSGELLRQAAAALLAADHLKTAFPNRQ